MRTRLATVADLPALADLYRKTVLAHAPQYYSEAQTQAWASVDGDSANFRQFILAATTYVMEDDTGILGFAGIADDGHVASVYVRCDRLHQGIGSRLMQTILAHAQRHGCDRLYAEASEFSLGLFKKSGFRQYSSEVVEHNGVTFTRALVEWTPPMAGD